MNPTLLYVYGGFNQPQLPTFTVSRLAWMEMGGVFALVCARGGGEYGRAWHEAAIKLNKQKTFDDVIAAGEWLQANRYTTPAHLGLQEDRTAGWSSAPSPISAPTCSVPCWPRPA
jgi:prolyl oligopeptidase